VTTPLILCAAITGGGPPRGRSPHQPATPAEIVQSALGCWRAGAAMIHFHARGDDGTTTTDPAAYAAIAARIRAAGCDAVLNISAGDDGGRASHAQRLAVPDSGVEVVSLDAGSFNAGERLYDNRPSYLWALAGRMRALGTVPEVEVFDLGHLHMVGVLAREGLLPPRPFVQFVFGSPGALPPDPALLPHLLRRLPPGAAWSVSAQCPDFGEHLALLMAAFTGGGHLRTGMEDQVLLRPGVPAPSNEAMVAQWANAARTWGRMLATPDEARRMLGIRQAARLDAAE